MNHLKKSIPVIVLLLVMGTLLISPSTSTTINNKSTQQLCTGTIFYVGGSGPGNYTTIQSAIDAASPHDTIYVYHNTYTENLYINISLTLMGEHPSTTIIDGAKHHDCIYIGFPADETTITGFTIQHSGNHSAGGAIFDAGLEIHSDYNTITNNIIQNHPLHGMVLWASKYNNISFNTIMYCNRSGIDFLSGPSNTIAYNILAHNEVGISALGSTHCKDNHIIANTFHTNYKGLAMSGSQNHISQNNFFDNYDWNAMSHFDFLRFKASRNQWDNNYWDDWKGFGWKWIPGFLGFNFDYHPAAAPFPYEEEIL